MVVKNLDRLVRSYFLWIIKFGFANLLVLLVMSLVTNYYYTPNLLIPPKGGESSHRYVPNEVFRRSTEGICWGRLDCNGYNNAYFNGQEPKRIDILLQGSSNIEAFHEPMNKNLGFLLNDLLCETLGLQTYNIGSNANMFSSCVAHNKAALNLFKPSKYVLVELTDGSVRDEKDLCRGLMGDACSNDTNTFPSRLKFFVSKISYIRHIYGLWITSKFSGARGIERKDGTVLSPLLRESFVRLASNAAEFNVKCIVFMHNRLILKKDGSFVTAIGSDELVTIARWAKEAGIIFVDPTERFIHAYKEEGILPHGFNNTLPNVGHVNREGHRMMAEAIAETIERLEAEEQTGEEIE